MHDTDKFLKALLINSLSLKSLTLFTLFIIFPIIHGYYSELDIPTSLIPLTDPLIYSGLNPLFIILLFYFLPIVILYEVYRSIPRKLTRYFAIIIPLILIPVSYKQLELIRDENILIQTIGEVALVFFSTTILHIYTKPLNYYTATNRPYLTRFLKAHKINTKKEAKSFKEFTKTFFFFYLTIFFLAITTIKISENHGIICAKKQTDFNTIIVNNVKHAFMFKNQGDIISKIIVEKTNAKGEVIRSYLKEGFCINYECFDDYSLIKEK